MDDVLEEASTWLVGGGILTMALFPFAVPILLLTALLLLPLALLALPLALPVLALRLIRRRGTRPGPADSEGYDQRQWPRRSPPSSRRLAIAKAHSRV
jgi:hypothetical protein